MSLHEEFLLSILKDKRVEDFVLLKEDYFEGKTLQLYKFSKDYFFKYKELPSQKLIEKKFKVTFDGIAEPFGYLKDEFFKMVLKQNLTSILTEVLSYIEKEPYRAFDELRKGIFKLDNENITLIRDVVTLDVLAEEILKEIQSSNSSSNVTGIPTGWKTLDEITQGYQKGDVYIYVARVKMGKSACILYSSDYANKSGYIPMVISMEMKIKQFARRHLALRSKIAYDYFKSKKLSKFAEKEVIKTINEMQKYPPFFYVEGQLKKDITELTSLVNLYNPHIVFIDGGYLLDIEANSRRQRWEEVELIMKSIKSLAMKSDIPIVVTFQFKREMLKKKQTDVGFEDIRLSDDIGAIASVVIGIFDKSPYEADIVEDVISAKRYLEVIGGREGETGGFYINWDWKNMDFSEITEEQRYDDLIRKDVSTYSIEQFLFSE